MVGRSAGDGIGRSGAEHDAVRVEIAVVEALGLGLQTEVVEHDL
jgi:hypothetical protein